MQPFCQNPQLSRSLESELECAVKSGELKLQSKNLKDFPKHGDRYNLQDTTLADLSRNKLVEVPGECTDYKSLERLLLYHNTIRSIPETISSLQSLQYLDISRNQLSYLPASVCTLTQLQCLVANNNKLVSLPEEIGEMTSLMELDVSCNEIAHLPVQIGDLSNLRSLHLRRNHLQEVPVELTYLQLTFLDLAANRLSSLPVELRFMITLCDLHLEENPLTCPPANLCGRGRVHIFKYLEIQAIKEDKKRGVLTDGEYRRSYRKTSQLNDMRFGGGLSADARRKRNTADSGYGSEQPLDRRWSQEFSQEADQHQQHTEDARRLAHRAISYRPASHVSTSSSVQSHPMIKPSLHIAAHTQAAPPRASPSHTRPIPSVSPRNHPSLTSNGSGSSGVSSLGSSTGPAYPHPHPTRSAPSPDRSDSAHGTSSTVSPTNSLDMMANLTIQENGKNGHTDVVDGRNNEESNEKVQNGKSQANAAIAHENGVNARENAKGLRENVSVMREATGKNRTEENGDSPDDHEKEERRRTAHRVFSKQGRTQQRPVGRLPLPKNSVSPKSYSPNSPIGPSFPKSGPSSPNSSGLPSPTPNSQLPVTSAKDAKPAASIQTYRQFKEQQRLNRQGETSSTAYRQDQKISDPGPTRSSYLSSHATRSESAHGAKSVQKHSLDIKSVQKEAVMSYIDRVGQSGPQGIPRAGAPPETSPPPPPATNGHSTASPRHHQAYSSQTNQKTTSIPTVSRASATTNRSRFGSSQSIPQPNYQANPSMNFTVRREADRAAVQDSHIHHLRHQIETRLKVSLGDDLPSSLTDGVVLCHIANHVSPRSVSSIHVPSPAVPKLSSTKCRRNVDNFLAACRKIGVREDLICAVSDVMEPKRTNTVRVAITVTELLRHHVPRNNNSAV